MVVASFEVETRQGLNAAIRRALHLDEDWLEVTTTDNPPAHLKIEEAGDVLDDVVGPMVNRLVNVSVVRRGKKLIYQDIELEE